MNDFSPCQPLTEPVAATLAARSRSGVALCLSGGGYRATLFHLGALRRLNELGVLPRLDSISAVSGGSIVAAHLIQHLSPWPVAPLSTDEWNKTIWEPFLAFTSRNIRTPALLSRLLPWNWFAADGTARSLAGLYREHLVQRSLPDLPRTPNVTFCSTDMAFGVNWVFERTRIGDYQIGYQVPDSSWSVADAVAASSCFPPVFAPMKLALDPARLTGGLQTAGPVRDRLIRGLRLTDGGVYDNMGLEPVWKSHV